MLQPTITSMTTIHIASWLYLILCFFIGIGIGTVGFWTVEWILRALRTTLSPPVLRQLSTKLLGCSP